MIEGFGPLQGDIGALPASLAARLTMLAWRIHWDFGEGDVPQDIEWAFDGEKIVILQTRPITALPRRTFPVLCSSRHWLPLLARILRRYAVGSSFIEHGNGDEHEGNHLGLARQENGTR